MSNMKNYCDECNHSGHLGTHCKKDYITDYINGCRKCGDMVNIKCYYEGIECPDFEQRYYEDPSGS